MIQTVRLSEIPTQPWRNGGGSTRQLLTWPTPEDWLLRISVASIDHNGPFSEYPGIERWFTVVSGHGVALEFEGTRLDLSADHEPMMFDGADAPDCTLLDGTTQDLNLMVLRKRGHGQMTRVRPGIDWLAASRFRAVYTAGPATLSSADGDSVPLAPGTLAWSTDAVGTRWRLTSGDSASTPSRAWWLAVHPYESDTPVP